MSSSNDRSLRAPVFSCSDGQRRTAQGLLSRRGNAVRRSPGLHFFVQKGLLRRSWEAFSTGDPVQGLTRSRRARRSILPAFRLFLPARWQETAECCRKACRPGKVALLGGKIEPSSPQTTGRIDRGMAAKVPRNPHQGRNLDGSTGYRQLWPRTPAIPAGMPTFITLSSSRLGGVTAPEPL